MEKIIVKKLKNGITLYVIPKKDYVQKEAMVTVRYGSAFTEFSVDGKKVTTPNGIAHFLEHKLFEDKSINIFDRFSKNGANANAYTNFNTTSYYFTTVDNFYENLELLCHMISSLYVTDENIEKERGIIQQEINMYKDDAGWQCYINMLGGMYKENPVRNNIAGSVDSISAITKQQLELCYNTFYTGDNTAVIIAGDVDIQRCEDIVSNTDINYGKIVRVSIGDNIAPVNEAYMEKEMNINKPRFSIGFKETDFLIPIGKRIALSNAAMDIIAGLSSRLYEDMYLKGIVDNDFCFEYLSGPGYGACIFSGTSKEPCQVAERLIARINDIKEKGIDTSHSDRIIKKQKAGIMRAYNSLDYICNSIADNFSKKSSPAELLNAYDKINKRDIEDRIDSHFREENMVISVVN